MMLVAKDTFPNCISTVEAVQKLDPIFSALGEGTNQLFSMACFWFDNKVCRLKEVKVIKTAISIVLMLRLPYNNLPIRALQSSEIDR